MLSILTALLTASLKIAVNCSSSLPSPEPIPISFSGGSINCCWYASSTPIFILAKLVPSSNSEILFCEEAPIANWLAIAGLILDSKEKSLIILPLLDLSVIVPSLCLVPTNL